MLAGLLVEKLGVDTGPLAWLGGLELDLVGYLVVGLFVVTWLVALAVWKLGRIEERWSPTQPSADPVGPSPTGTARG